MPNVYKALAKNPPGTPDLIGINQAPGKIIMRQVPVHARTMDNLLTSFCNYFHTPGNWTWTGAAVTPPAENILDGDAITGQCLALARAFRMLATMPWPHGLGLTTAAVGDPRLQGCYDGRYHKGFVSTHPPAGVLGLSGNVFDTANGNLLLCGRGFYSWQDHKVVPYNGIFYDPSYRTTYPALPSMAVYHVIKEVDIGPNSYVVVDDHTGARQYYRGLTLNECNTVHPQVGFGAAMQGPYPGPLPDGRNLMQITL